MELRHVLPWPCHPLRVSQVLRVEMLNLCQTPIDPSFFPRTEQEEMLQRVCRARYDAG